MTTTILFAAVVALMGLLAFLTFGLAGKGNPRAPGSPGTPYTSVDLRNDYGDRLSNETYSVFSDAVRRHLTGDLRGAITGYESLRRVRHPNDPTTTFDLVAHSRIVSHNLALARSELS